MADLLDDEQLDMLLRQLENATLAKTDAILRQYTPAQRNEIVTRLCRRLVHHYGNNERFAVGNVADTIDRLAEIQYVEAHYD